MYACSNSCGQQSDSVDTFKVCSKCKSVRYCSKDCQVAHWKGGHKNECAFYFLGSCCQSTPLNIAADLAKKALNGQRGCAIFLGENHDRSHGEPQFNILTDLCQTEPKPIVPELHLEKTPPWMLVNAPKAGAFIPGDDPSVRERCKSLEEYLRREDDFLRALLPGINRFSPIVEMAFVNEYNGAVGAIEKVVQSALWSSHIASPQGDGLNRESLIGKRLMLGGGIEMMHITYPGVCFAKLTATEIACFDNRMNPVLRVPVVIFGCREEGWRLVMLSNKLGLIYMHPQATTMKDDEVILLKVAAAAAEIGDLGSILSLWDIIRRAAVNKHEEILAVGVLEKTLPLLEHVYPQAKRLISKLLHEIGFLHDARASRLSRKKDDEAARNALVDAATAYKRAAEISKAVSPLAGIHGLRYNALGVTLKRLGDLEMSKRAYLWAFTDYSFCNPPGCPLPDNMVSVCKAEYLTESECKRQDKDNLKEQRKIHKKPNEATKSLAMCENCKDYTQETWQCRRCMAVYCSHVCQKNDWSEHKKECIKRPAITTHYQRCAQCPDETRAFLASVGYQSMHFDMTIAYAQQCMEEFILTRDESVVTD